MTLNVLFAARDALWDDYRDTLPKAFEAAGVAVNLSRDHAPKPSITSSTHPMTG